MKKQTLIIFALFISSYIFSCTNFIVTKGASADGSTMMVYTNDGEWLYHLKINPYQKHDKGEMIKFPIPGTKEFLEIPQPSETYKKLGFQMNEYQVAVGETTFTGREELWNKNLPLKYWHLMGLALDRAKTAREAIQVITSLVEKYGYGSEGESFSIIDPNEAWILEMIGTGDGKPGANWVAIRIPDGAIAAHANKARIGSFPLNDPENCLYSKTMIPFAIDKGYYNPKTDGELVFNQIFNPISPDRLRYCESRVWSLFRRAAPEQEFSSDYNRGIQEASRYPLYIFPKEKLSLKKVMGLVRDHYEGTEMDMTKGMEAGPFGSPQRWRPLSWEQDGHTYAWERSISTYNTCFSFVAQAQSNLPNELGGICWFGFDDTYFTCYLPIYMGVEETPESYRIGDIRHYNPSSMWWAMNFVSNYANLKYSYMIKDIQAVQNRLEDQMIADQDSIREAYIAGTEQHKAEILQNYVNTGAQTILEEWNQLGYQLIAKYNDGYIKPDSGGMLSPGYPEEWKNKIIEQDPEKHLLPDWNKKGRQKDNPF
jgi:dipeptidase